MPDSFWSGFGTAGLFIGGAALALVLLFAFWSLCEWVDRQIDAPFDDFDDWGGRHDL